VQGKKCKVAENVKKTNSILYSVIFHPLYSLRSKIQQEGKGGKNLFVLYAISDF